MTTTSKVLRQPCRSAAVTALGNQLIAQIERGNPAGSRDGHHHSVLGEVHVYQEGEQLTGSYQASPGQLIVNDVPLMNGFYAAACILLSEELDRRNRKTPFRATEALRLAAQPPTPERAP